MTLDLLSTSGLLLLTAVLALLERLPGARLKKAPVKTRWMTNIGLMLLGGIFVSVLLPFTPSEAASGLENGGLRQLPLGLEIALVFLVLDCWRYWEHRVFHEVSALWRIHLVHHSDTAFDITTSQRHHPLEGVLAGLLLLVLVFALGLSAEALGFYLAIALLSSVYSHANLHLPESVEKYLRPWLVTPSVHAVHHYSYQPHTDSNYGAVLTIWDRMFGTYTDPREAPVKEFGLEYFRTEADAALAPALLHPFEYSRNAKDDPRPATSAIDSDSPATPLTPQWRQTLTFGSIGLALLLLAFWPTMIDLVRAWSGTDPYQYAWLVVPMFVYVVGWHYRDELLSLTPQPGYAGVPVALVAALLWAGAYVIDIKILQQLALVIALQGLFICTLGWAIYRQYLPAMLLLFLMLPSGDLLQPLLRGLTVNWIEWFALLTGLPHLIEGYVVHIGEHRYVVVDACSGLTYFTLAGFLGYSFGLLLFRSLGKVVAMAALGAALGIATNAARVCLIVSIDWIRGSQMDLAAHGDVQWIVLLAALASLLLLASKLQQDAGTNTASPANRSTQRWLPAHYSPALVGTLVLALTGAAGVLVKHATTFDREGAMRQLADQYPEARKLENNGSVAALNIPVTNTLEAIVVLPDSGSFRVTEASVRLEDESIWRHASTATYRDCHGAECIAFKHLSWQRKGSDEVRHTFYTYYVGNTATDSKLTYRLTNGLNLISGNAGYDSGIIGFRTSGDLPEDISLSDLYRQLRNRPS